MSEITPEPVIDQHHGAHTRARALGAHGPFLRHIPPHAALLAESSFDDSCPSDASRADLFGDRRRHVALRTDSGADGTRSAARDRCAGTAGALPDGPGLRAGRSGGGDGEPARGTAPGTGDDPAFRERPVRPHARAGGGGADRPVLLATPRPPRDLQAPLGQWRTREGDLSRFGPLQGPRREGELTDPFMRATLIAAAALIAWMLIGIAGAWMAGL